MSLDSAVPAKAKQIVETITYFYVGDQLQAKLDANKRATGFFDDRLAELKRKVASRGERKQGPLLLLLCYYLQVQRAVQGDVCQE